MGRTDGNLQEEGEKGHGWIVACKSTRHAQYGVELG